MDKKLHVIATVEGGCLVDVTIQDADGNPVDFELTIDDHDQPRDDEEYENYDHPDESAIDPDKEQEPYHTEEVDDYGPCTHPDPEEDHQLD